MKIKNEDMQQRSESKSHRDIKEKKCNKKIDISLDTLAN